MTTPFSAGPQALGYLHQVRYALYALLRESNEEAAVVIEGLDDIEITGTSGPIQLDQLKHHIKGRAKLTDANPDIWKTIRIWSTQMRNKDWDPTVTKLHLVTTAEAPKDSAAWYLKAHDQRDEQKARDLLLQTASTSRTEDKAMRDAFTEFQALSESEQLRMLRAATISDNAYTITELEPLIKKEIRPAAPPSKGLLDGLYQELEGWWFAQAVEHLVKNSREPITLIALRRKLWSITDRLREDNLPITFADAMPDTVIAPDKDDRVFVRQLRCIDVKIERIGQAILDYYRAFEQRAKWVRDELLIDDELIVYERKLVDAWTQYRLARLDEETEEALASEDCCRRIGREILKGAHEVNIRIKPQVDEWFVLRGSYHMLANTERPRVYWHPKFLERLEELLRS